MRSFTSVFRVGIELLRFGLTDFRVVDELRLPPSGVASRPLASAPNGATLYFPMVADGECRVAALAVGEDRIVATAPCIGLMGTIAVEPEGTWVVAASYADQLGTHLLTVWDAELTTQIALRQVRGGLFVLVPGACLDVDPCPADCNGDGVVSVNEVVRAVRSALAGTEPLDCFAADSTGDDRVTVDERVAAVEDLLQGCN
ncbi:MAG: lactonase family protein [Candidatus Binatia bacterium]|nr:lactonase family protein [Candidatus Binatia bacterium]